MKNVTKIFSVIFCRSIIEPIRNIGFRETDHFHLSHAFDLDVTSQTIRCQSVLKPNLEYDLKYDKLVIGVGAVSNTFGVPGVAEHAFFLKVNELLILLLLTHVQMQ